MREVSEGFVEIISDEMVRVHHEDLSVLITQETTANRDGYRGWIFVDAPDDCVMAFEDAIATARIYLHQQAARFPRCERCCTRHEPGIECDDTLPF